MSEVRTLFKSAGFSAIDYVCTANAHDAPFEEYHSSYTLAFVRRGSFGAHARGQYHELTSGGFFIGAPGLCYRCSHHHHHGGDECLSFQFTPESALELGAKDEAWRRVSTPPIEALAPLGALAQAAANKRIALGLDEAALLLARRFAETMSAVEEKSLRSAPRETRRALDAAAWIEANSGAPIQLADAAQEAGLSPFHFLRVFSAAIGATPNQVLIAHRLRAAAERIASGGETITEIAFAVGFDDLSHFQRMFKRAAGITPGQFRRLAKGDRKILQERLGRPH